LIELDAASNTQVDNMRDLLENALYAPTSARFKVYIIDEVHMLSRNAFNAMLKTLEEPPGHVKFISRHRFRKNTGHGAVALLQFNLKQIPQTQIKEQLKKIIALEGVEGDEEALTLLARAAHGSMRDSLSLLDQALHMGAAAWNSRPCAQCSAASSRSICGHPACAAKTGRRSVGSQSPSAWPNAVFHSKLRCRTWQRFCIAWHWPRLCRRRSLPMIRIMRQ